MLLRSRVFAPRGRVEEYPVEAHAPPLTPLPALHAAHHGHARSLAGGVAEVLRMLGLGVHVEAVLVAGHVGAVLALLGGQPAALVAQMARQVLLVGVGLLAARADVRAVRGHHVVQRGHRLNGQRPGL